MIIVKFILLHEHHKYYNNIVTEFITPLVMKKMMDENNFYILKKSELLEDFKEFSSGINIYLSGLMGDEFSKSAVDEMRVEFEKFIIEIPYIGGDDNPMTPNLLSSVRYLMVYLVLNFRGIDVKEIGEMCYKHEDEFFKAHPQFVPPLCNPYVIKSLEKSALESGKYSEDFAYSYVEGEDFDLGLDFTECALLKLYKNYSADDFMPYICAMDIIMSKYGDLGLYRSKTLAEGCDVCDFRYKAGRETNVASEVVKNL